MDDQVHNSLETAFTRKRLGKHVAALAQRWRTFVLSAIAVFGTIWTMFEAPAYLLDANLRGVRFYSGAILTSLLLALAWTVREYVHGFPEGFEHESKAAQRIAQLQRIRWEYRLARQLLKDVLTDLDDELSALLDGKVFVPITSSPDFASYIGWVAMGPPNVIRMVRVAEQLVVMDLPSVLGAADVEAKEQSIRAVVYRIRDLYAATVEFERSRRSTRPPEGAERLHELQLGWTSPVRNGINQLFDFIDEMLAAPLKGDHTVKFTVTMREPDILAEFKRELNRIETSNLHLA